jgi:hypothetical protein
MTHEGSVSEVYRFASLRHAAATRTPTKTPITRPMTMARNNSPPDGKNSRGAGGKTKSWTKKTATNAASPTTMPTNAPRTTTPPRREACRALSPEPSPFSAASQGEQCDQLDRSIPYPGTCVVVIDADRRVQIGASRGLNGLSNPIRFEEKPSSIGTGNTEGVSRSCGWNLVRSRFKGTPNNPTDRVDCARWTLAKCTG